jgi:protein O-mannosyl-transferase
VRPFFLSEPMSLPESAQRLPPIAAIALLLTQAWLAYLPGLTGGFLLDDLINLDALGKRGRIDDWPAFWRYITSGTADPTGRPLTLLSFLLDARDWPADPRPFLRTNLVLHLLNGALLFALLRALGRHLDGARARSDWEALLGAGIWLLHPLLVSTTLYIVQREAMLPATFVMGGLLAYVHGRRLHATRPRAGAAWMLAGIGLGTLLAVLSKANGILLPLLALVLEATVLRAGDGSAADATARRLRWWRRGLLLLPSILLAAYLARHFGVLHEPLEMRPWTIAERLLTQPRVLLDYLQLLVVPRAISTGLYNDAYVASTGLLAPASTLPALLAILSLLGLALAVRRSRPVLAAGLLFWFAGHLLESSVLPLELYFEHRNYLPAMLLFWPLARALGRWHASPLLRTSLALVLLSFLAFTTWQRASLWGDPSRMALAWAAQNPDSPRAQATAAMQEMQGGRPDLALQRLAPLAARHPHELQLVLTQADARCLLRGLGEQDVAAVEIALHGTRQGQQLAWRWLGGHLDRLAEAPCQGLDAAALKRWITALNSNPTMQSSGRRQDAGLLAGRLALASKRPDEALAHFDRALAAEPTPDAAAVQASLLARHGFHRHALAHLDHYERLHAATSHDGELSMRRIHGWVLKRQGFWEREFQALRDQLMQEPALHGGESGADLAPATQVPY